MIIKYYLPAYIDLMQVSSSNRFFQFSDEQ